ncbi:CCR4-NOT core complex subunit Not4 [Histoplasma ohiense]|nr:CCR4-NOT core complex subunit Not4 [Histoplasma ohiense (nom. inval.)]
MYANRDILDIADEDFPPLGPPTKPLDKRPLETFRIASGSRASHDSNDSTYRSRTPILPPGLPVPHGHPAASFVQDLSPSTSAVSSPQPGHITLRSGFSTPVQKFNELHISAYPTSDVQASSAVPSAPARTRAAVEISSGSPKPKTVTAVRQQSDGLIVKKDKGRELSPEKVAAPITKEGKQPREPHSKPIPIKLNLSMPTPGHASPSRTTTPNHNVSSIHQLSNISPHPNTPLTGVSRTSDSPVPRQTRVLRVVDTSKSETPTSSVAPNNSTPPSKYLSRQPSLSTNSRPDTPNNVDSEYDFHTSASVSRASSPPPSRVGSAPVRSITKSQLKKERKLKAKQAEVKKEENHPTPVVAEEPVQAPIIGRKRKTKKAPAPAPTKEQQAASASKPEVTDNAPHVAKSKNKSQNHSESSTQAKGSDNSARESVPKEHAPRSQTTEKSEKSEPWRSNNTAGQLLADSEATGVPVKDLFLERTSPLPVLLAQLHQSGDLDLTTHPLFNPPNLNQRSDLKCSADDYDILKNPIELAEEHRTKLLQGEPVHINADTDLLKCRCLITPAGSVLRHLSEEEEFRYLELEKSLVAAWQSLQEYPALTATEPDATNRGGGLDALFATPENFNIRWIDGAPENGLLSGSVKPSSMPSPPPVSASGFSTESSSSEAADAARGSASTGAMATTACSHRSSTAPKSTTSGSHLGVSLEDLMSMSDEELRAMIEEAQRELESSRKEVDMVDKKVMTLVKRNKKLVQQALSAAMEFVGSTSDMGL